MKFKKTHTVAKKYLKYKISKSSFNFEKFQTIRFFSDSILSNKITISEADGK